MARKKSFLPEYVVNSRFSPLFLAVLVAFNVLLFGTLGYVFIENWPFFDAFYMAVITLTTIGYGEVHSLSFYGRLFTIIFVGIGWTLFVFIINYATQEIIEGNLSRFLGVGTSRKIKRMKQHIIICGFGRMGVLICEQLEKQNVPFLIIERDLTRYQSALEVGYDAVHGDATDDQILERSNISSARGLVSVLDSDTMNVFVTLSARQLKPDLYILARAVEDHTVRKLHLAGASKVISPYTIGGMAMANALVRPHVADFIEFATDSDAIDFGIESASVGAESDMCGKNLIESGIRSEYEAIVLSIMKADGETQFNPNPKLVISKGDRLILAGKPDQLSALIARLEGHRQLHPTKKNK